jgi:hypothetical protein
MNNNNYDFFFLLNVVANVLQIQSYEMLKKEISNNDIMESLRHQDNDYLEKIIKQNQEIISLLKDK